MAAKVEIKNKTGIGALDAIIKASSQKFGKDLSSEDYGDYVPFSSGSLSLDLALYIGGIPTGRIIEILGENSSNKTSFCLSFMARKQQSRVENNARLRAIGTPEALAEVHEKRDLILDLEHSLTRSFIQGFGIDMDQTIWKRCDSAEEALQISLDYVKSGAIDIVIIDSVDAMQNKKQQARQVGENDVGGISKDMNFAVRQIAKLSAEYMTTYLFINQIKMNPGKMFGSPETTPGGRALEYYASLRLKCMTRQPCPDLPRATTMRIQIKKSRCGPDYTEIVYVPFVHGTGVAELLDVQSVAKDFKLLRNSAGQTKVRWNPDDEDCWEPLLPDIEKGKDAAQRALSEKPWLLAKLRALCLYAGGVTTAATLEEIKAMGPPVGPAEELSEVVEEPAEMTNDAPAGS